MSEITDDAIFLMDMDSYVKLHDCTITRLILFNGCWVGQPYRLIITEWKDAENDVWLDKNRLK